MRLESVIVTRTHVKWACVHVHISIDCVHHCRLVQPHFPKRHKSAATTTSYLHQARSRRPFALHHVQPYQHKAGQWWPCCAWDSV